MYSYGIINNEMREILCVCVYICGMQEIVACFFFALSDRAGMMMWLFKTNQRFMSYDRGSTVCYVYPLDGYFLVHQIYISVIYVNRIIMKKNNRVICILFIHHCNDDW